MSACVDYVHFDDYGHCYCQIVEDYRGIAKMSYRLHRKKKKKKSWALVRGLEFREKEIYIFLLF